MNKEKFVNSDEDEVATASIPAAASKTTALKMAAKIAAASKMAVKTVAASKMTAKTAAASKTVTIQEKEEYQGQEEDQEDQGQEEGQKDQGQEEGQEEQGQEEQEQEEEDIFNLIIGQEIGNQEDNEVKGGGNSDLYNYSSSNEDEELFKLVKKKL